MATMSIFGFGDLAGTLGSLVSTGQMLTSSRPVSGPLAIKTREDLVFWQELNPMKIRYGIIILCELGKVESQVL
jgi:hypothetical protein